MELHLLKGRFPNNPLIDNYGNLLNEFFCARNFDQHSYEGRLFLAEKALFFVSSYSAAVSYDKAIELSQITQALVLKQIIPSVEFILTDGKERFTNFHDLNKIAGALKALLPDKLSFEVKKLGVHPKLNRLVSSPGKSQRYFNSHPSKELESVPCPYFSRSGFCPRKGFCKLRHDPPAVSSPVSFPVQEATTSSSMEKLATHLRPPPGQELFRSISSPACSTRDNSEHSPTSSGQVKGHLMMDDLIDPDSKQLLNQEQLTLAGIQENNEEVEGEEPRTPDPVSKSDRDSVRQMITGIDMPPVPSTFVFGNQKRKALGDIFTDSDQSNEAAENGGQGQNHNGTTPNVSPPPGYMSLTYDDDYQPEEDEFYDVEMPSTLTVYPASHIQRSDINSGDKVILSSEVLVACEQREINYPMAFCFRSRTSDKLVHAGVLEFTSPLEQTAYLPQWMFEHLNVTHGELVDFQHVDLPKGTFVQLQPVSSAWLGVPYDKRTAIMEFQLRNFQTLTENTKVTIVYELNKYTFKVLQCKPSIGISIVDSDLTTDVVEPADLNRFHSVEEWQAENIGLSEPIHCTVSAGTYRHFVLLSLPGKELPNDLHVEVKGEGGDPDLFLCQMCSAPSQSRYTWCDQSIGDCNLSLSTKDEDYSRKKSVFAGVVSLTENAKFTICFYEEVGTVTASPGGDGLGHVLRSSTGDNSAIGPTGSTGSTGHVLRSVTNSSSGDVGSINGEEERKEGDPPEETDGEPPLIPPGHGQCSYCGSVMPQLKLLMHERHCVQSNFKCPICKVCLPKMAEKKHPLIAHKLLKCECGEELSQLHLHRHQLTQCVKRSVKCQFEWCHLSFPLDQLQNHESMCGRKLIPCPVCSVEVSNIELKVHLEIFHNVMADKLDWSKPINSQTLSYKPREPNFKCHCGIGFEFEDDLQVHQLTECCLESVSDNFIG